MPVAVTCPSCDATFKVKDEYAGKRAKCPKCGEPLTVPSAVGPADTVRMPPPLATARPVVANKPKPVTSDDEEAPKPKRRRDDDDDQPRAKKRARDEYEDEKPKSKRRDDGEEDTPKKKRRRDDDEKPKKGSALPLILGIVGGVILLCGGGCAGVWFGVIAPAAEQARKLNDENQAELNKWEEALNKPPAGKERPPEQPPAATLTVEMFIAELQVERQKYAKKWVKLSGPVTVVNTDSRPGRPDEGHIVLGSGNSSAKCYFPSDEWAKLPKFDDAKTYSVIGLVSDNELLGASLDWCRVPGESTTTTPGPKSNTPNAVEVTAEQFLADFQANQAAALRKYGGGKKVKVTGLLTTGVGTGESFYMAIPKTVLNKSTGTVQCFFDPADWGESKALKVGTQAAVVGTLTSAKKEADGGFVLKLTNCKVGK